MASKLFAVLAVLFIFACLLDSTEGWRGKYERYRVLRGSRRRYCICRYRWWGCSWWRWRWETYYTYDYRCQRGWTHNGNKNCNIPICRPTCANGGTCQRPNVCNCPTTAIGPWCSTLTCSYLKPCYPGNCLGGSDCECEPGFKTNGQLTRETDGCITFDSSVETMYPTISRCTATIKNIRRADNRTNFEFVMDGTNTTETEQVWSNQMRFNVLQFEIESTFPEFENPPERPPYVFSAGYGIVAARIQMNITKISRSDTNGKGEMEFNAPFKYFSHIELTEGHVKVQNCKGSALLYEEFRLQRDSNPAPLGSPIRDPGVFETYDCPHLSDTEPEPATSNCTIYDDQFITLIEHGDWMEVRYQAKSGGFRELRNIDRQNQHYRTDSYIGLEDVKEVKFLFDFIVPQHCAELVPPNCPPGAVLLKVEEEFTKNAITLFWKGWTDDLSGLGVYYIEIFQLLPDPYGRLVERHPVDPLFNTIVNHTDIIEYPAYTPDRAGIYSVLMEVRDNANNSKIARRFVIYDSVSEIILNTKDTGKLYVSSANPLSDYKWQTIKNADTGKFDFTVNWDNHFINKVHEDGKFLNRILPYPIQFEAIEDDGVLSSKKFVNESMDDYEGNLTRNGIENFHGIVQFEVRKVYTHDTEVPVAGWEDISLAENHTFSVNLRDGDDVRIWVRATDIMGNSQTDSTYIQVDTTAPVVSANNSADTKLVLNIEETNAKYNYTSRISFDAEDGDSDLYEIQYKVTVESFGKEPKIAVTGNQSADSQTKQTLDLDNCWFIVNKEDLEVSRAVVDVTVYNRAMLGASLQFQIERINTLRGLEKYSGPENFRIETTKSESFRIAWDLPDQISCYGHAEIVLFIATIEDGETKTEVIYVSKGATSYPVAAKPNTKYTVAPAMQLVGGNPVPTGENLAVQTPEPEEATGVPTGVVAGVAVGVIVLVAIVLVVFILLIRRGHFQPVRKGVERAKTIVARKARETFYGDTSISQRPSHRLKNQYAYDNRASELYIYGGMDFDENQSWHIPRSDVTFETLLKSGHFANIYKTIYNRNKKTHETVVAKTLKENSSESDQMLMKAKINFTATVVGNHPNVVKFIGAVIDDPAMGPFIIYEYCEHGPLKDYLQSQKSNVTLEVQENLFRFGLDIAKGMEFLASKGIVHRRLAARNILLTFLNEVKIAGFGPQPASGSEDDGDTEKGKKERIPIKWMGPECMASTADATEKSDVWSYAVVLWEIFSLGSTPYENIRSRDLAGRLKKGERLQQPEYCDDTWYGVMRQCWALEQDKRPTFSEVRNQLDGLFVAAPGDDYYYYKR